MLKRIGLSFCIYWFAVSSQFAMAQPSAEQALSLVPMQRNVPFDASSEQLVADAKIQAVRKNGQRAWVVTDGDGNVLRRFVDTNGDNKIDQWCYYQSGLETYRDIDADFNEKADQYRWFGTAGIRWGMDPDEDGRIDSWKWISPEEVTAELVGAIQEQDARRYRALLLSAQELQRLDLPEDLELQLKNKLRRAQDRFLDWVKQQSSVTSDSEWVDFSAPRPGAIPASSPATDDLIVYENVIAILDGDGQHGELTVGTLLKFGGGWRLIDLPDDSNGFFFTATQRRVGAQPPADGNIADPKVQQLVEALQALDEKLANATSGASIAAFYRQRSDVIRKLIDVSSGEEKDMWLNQLIDSVSAAFPPDGNKENVAALRDLDRDVTKATNDKKLIAQARFPLLTARYTAELQEPNANYAAIQERWISNLQEFVQEFPGTPTAADAMLQLAISEEFAGNTEQARKWYQQIAGDYGDSDIAKKAAGAMRRLALVGKPLELQGTGLDNRPVEVSDFRGKLTVVHYWATWCEPCKEDIDRLRKLVAKYGPRRFAALGINLDESARAAASFVRSERISWPQIHDAGGLDSPLATRLGVFTLPVMILVDRDGTVINRSLGIAELEAELEKRFPRRR